jgi:hypothetical protein
MTIPIPRPTRIVGLAIVAATVVGALSLAGVAVADVGGSSTTAGSTSAAGGGQGLLDTSIDNAWAITASAGGRLAMIATAVGVLVALLVFKSWKGAISVFGAAIAASWVLGGGFWSTAQDTSAQLSQGISNATQQTTGK